jgi:hypothetical protein
LNIVRGQQLHFNGSIVVPVAQDELVRAGDHPSIAQTVLHVTVLDPSPIGIESTTFVEQTTSTRSPKTLEARQERPKRETTTRAIAHPNMINNFRFIVLCGPDQLEIIADTIIARLLLVIRRVPSALLQRLEPLGWTNLDILEGFPCWSCSMRIWGPLGLIATG